MSPAPAIPHTVNVQRAPADIGSAVDVIVDNHDNGCVLFIVEQKHWEEQLKVITQARAASVHNRVLVHRSRLSPLGISTLLEILSVLAPQLSAAQVVSACERLDDEIVPFALVKSVAKLTAANPSVWQHLSSWLPSTMFVAQAGGQVINCSKLDDNREFLSRYAGAVQIVQQGALSAGGEHLDTVRRFAQPSSIIERPVEPSDFWGTSTLAEWCFAPADVARIVAELQSNSTVCRWCQEPFATPQCPMCSSPSFYGGSK